MEIETPFFSIAMQILEEGKTQYMGSWVQMINGSRILTLFMGLFSIISRHYLLPWGPQLIGTLVVVLEGELQKI